MKYFISLWGVLGLLVFPNANAYPITDGSISLYRKAADYYHTVSLSGDRATREKWMESIKLFKEVYINFPKGGKSPEALYMTGKIYKELYSRYRNSPYRENAVTIFRVLVKSHSNNHLADDALYLTGEIYLLDGDYTNALASFRGLIRWFPDGDMAKSAKRRIKEVLPKARQVKNRLAKSEEKGRSEFSHLKSVRFWSSDSYARVVFDVTRMVNYRIYRFSKERTLIIDLLGARFEKTSGRSVKREKGIISSITVSHPEADFSRIRIVLNREHSINSMELSDPERIVLDIYGEKPPKTDGSALTAKLDTKRQIQATAEKTVKETYQQAAGKAVPIKTIPQIQKNIPASASMQKKTTLAAMKTTTKAVEKVAKASLTSLSKRAPPVLKVSKPKRANPALVQARLVKQTKIDKRKLQVTTKSTKPMRASLRPTILGFRTIVIDPGHGGRDPGAVGKRGLKEKDVVLSISKRLKRILEKECRCRVVMTRTKDVYIPLEERTAIANTVNADLFISIHTNANPKRSIHGIETYFLSPARSKEEMHTAARENMVKLSNGNEIMDDINFIFSDMQNTDKINQSNQMAMDVQKSLVKTLRQKYKTKNNGVKQAMFYVLHGARMPSILVETSFISNKTGERKLRSPQFRQQIAQGIARGIRYFAAENQVALVK